MSFSNLKKNNKSIFAKLSQELEKSQNTQSGGADERIWKPEMDVSGNGYAVIRFLPAPDGEDIPWAKLWSHAFQGPGGWYIENSLTTMNQKDPVSEYNRELWNSGSDKDKEIVRKQKRKLSYYANIYVVQDPKNPENEGRGSFTPNFNSRDINPVPQAMKEELNALTPPSKVEEEDLDESLSYFQRLADA